MLLCFVNCPVFTPRAFFLSSSVAGTHSRHSCHSNRYTLTASSIRHALTDPSSSQLHRYTLTVSLLTSSSYTGTLSRCQRGTHSLVRFFVSSIVLSNSNPSHDEVLTHLSLHSHRYTLTVSSSSSHDEVLTHSSLRFVNTFAPDRLLRFFNRHKADLFFKPFGSKPIFFVSTIDQSSSTRFTHSLTHCSRLDHPVWYTRWG